MSGAWTSRLPGAARPRARLVCLPFAGGGAAAFRPWRRSLPADVELVLAHLPGRESRIAEPAHRRAAPLADALARALPRLDDLPTAFFGHSMGALLAFETARSLRRHGLPGPARLFLSAHRAPGLPRPRPPTHALPDPEFLREFAHAGGLPEAFLRERELVEMLLPTLRADAELCETHEHRPEPPLAAGISAYGGLADEDVACDTLEPWREHTTGPFHLRLFPGDHFFLRTAEADLLAVLSAEIAGLVPR